MEFIPLADIRTFANEGVISEQLLFPENSKSGRVTITRVTLRPGSVQPRHTHESSEQVWIALEGCGTLLLAGEKEKSFSSGDVVRFADGDVHGLHNTGAGVFKYMSITSPPINFRRAYADES